MNTVEDSLKQIEKNTNLSGTFKNLAASLFDRYLDLVFAEPDLYKERLQNLVSESFLSSDIFRSWTRHKTTDDREKREKLRTRILSLDQISNVVSFQIVKQLLVGNPNLWGNKDFVKDFVTDIFEKPERSDQLKALLKVSAPASGTTSKQLHKTIFDRNFGKETPLPIDPLVNTPDLKSCLGFY